MHLRISGRRNVSERILRAADLGRVFLTIHNLGGHHDISSFGLAALRRGTGIRLSGGEQEVDGLVLLRVAVRILLQGEKARHGDDVHHDQQTQIAHQRQTERVAEELRLGLVGVAEDRGGAYGEEYDQKMR